MGVARLKNHLCLFSSSLLGAIIKEINHYEVEKKLSKSLHRKLQLEISAEIEVNQVRMLKRLWN